MNVVMQRGKKACAERIVYGALNKIIESTAGKKEKDDESAVKTTKKGKASTKGRNIKNDEEYKKLVLELFSKALDAVRPAVEVRSRRVGGATYQIPVEVKQDRGMALAMRWLVKYSAVRGEKTMALRLAAEIMDAIEGRGGSVKKREDVHKMARANQAFAHYRW